MPRRHDAHGLGGRTHRDRVSLQRVTAELLGKRWMDAVAPVALFVVVVAYFATTTPAFLGTPNVITVCQILAETGLLALGLTVVLVGGGIDLSVGAVYAVANTIAVVAYKSWQLPVPLVVLVAIGVGALCGSLNGVLIAGFRTRPFITTLVTMLLFRSVATLLDSKVSAEVGVLFREDRLWTAISNTNVGPFPVSFIILLVVVLVFQVVLTRSRYGWRLMAIGASRSAARRAGMPLGRMVFSSYVVSGGLSGLAGFLVATRLEQTAQSTGLGYELVALTAVIIGGVSLAGGRGTAARALIGAAVTGAIYQGFAQQGRPYDVYTGALAVILVVFATIDIKYSKNKDKAIAKIFVVPGHLDISQGPNVYEPGSVWNPNRRLTGARPIGLGQVDGPEDVVVGASGEVYCGDRRGYVWRFDGPDHANGSVFCRVGGHPLGLAIDADRRVIVCVGGMGLYAINPDGSAQALATRVRRTWWSLRDDSAIRVADDLDIAPDGKIYFSDASTRFDAAEHFLELLEARPNGRLLCFDPATGKTTVVVRNCSFPNGVCVSHDGRSVLLASTILCRVDRLWIDGPKAGTFEPFLTDLPGHPDNINRASDGTYWMAFAAMRSPSFDLALRSDTFRRRMIKELSPDDWLTPNLNTSCVFKVDEDGNVLESLWDETHEDHSLITSMREHDGRLFLGGLVNNRVGVVPLEQSLMPAGARSQALEGDRVRSGLHA
jgi:ribose transport system permease protein